MAFCGLRNRFECFIILAMRKGPALFLGLILNSFSLIFPRDGDILKKTFCRSGIVLWYYFYYSLFISVVDESKYGRVLKIKRVIG